MLIAIAFLAVVAATIALTAIGTRAFRGTVRHHMKEGHHDVLVPIFLTGGTIYAVFLAFLVVSVWESYDAAQTNAGAEASTLATLYRATEGMEPVMGGELRGLIRAYTRDVVVQEWSVQARDGGTSPDARAQALKMFKLFGNPTQLARKNDMLIDQAALNLLDQTMTERNTRVTESGNGVAPIIWLAAIASAVITIGMTFFLFMETVWLQVVMASFMATMICMLLCIVFLLSRPFAGPIGISPHAYQHALFVYDDIDASR